MSGVLVAVLVGAGIAAQVRVLGSASLDAHPLAVSFSLQFAGGLVGLVWVAARDEWSTVLSVALRWWWVPLGVGGWVLVAALGFASSRIGVAATLAVSIAVQLVVGLVLDARADAAVGGATVVLGAMLIVVGATLVATS